MFLVSCFSNILSVIYNAVGNQNASNIVKTSNLDFYCIKQVFLRTLNTLSLAKGLVVFLVLDSAVFNMEGIIL